MEERIEGSSALEIKKKHTLEEWRSWPDDERWELIEGEAWAMSPAPSRLHQKRLGNLATLLHVFLEDKEFEVYIAPIDVFLREEGDLEDSVVQPDILVVCDKTKLIDEGIRGAPDFIIEILSPSTASKDLEEKKALYQKHGVKEYWAVKSDGSVFVWLLKDNKYLPSTEYLADMPVPSAVLSGFIWPKRLLYKKN